MVDHATPDVGIARDNERAGGQYFLLADISGYTGFLNGGEQAHLVDLSSDMPAGYEILGELLDAVIDGVQPVFGIEQIEGDAVFAVADAAALDGQGGSLMVHLQALYDDFRAVRERAASATDHVCAACPVVRNLDLKYVLHRGTAVRVRTGSHAELHGPAVNVVHRLLKNSVHSRIGFRPYLLLTAAAAAGLDLVGTGTRHKETYPDVGVVDGEIIELLTDAPEAKQPPE